MHSIKKCRFDFGNDKLYSIFYTRLNKRDIYQINENMARLGSRISDLGSLIERTVVPCEKVLSTADVTYIFHGKINRDR